MMEELAQPEKREEISNAKKIKYVFFISKDLLG